MADKYIGVIVTDGQENSSREWDKDRINQAIESRLNAGNWTFTYLGTQPETWGDASTIGIGAGASATYTGNMARAAYAATADAVHGLSASASMGSRSVLSSHGNMQRMASAGMSVGKTAPQLGRPVPPKPSLRPPTLKKTLTPSKRWR